MTAVTRRPGLGTSGVAALAVLLLAAMGAFGIWTLASLVDGQPRFVNPFQAIVERQPWTSAHTTAAVLVAAAVVLAATAAIVLAIRAGKDRAPVDRAAAHMGRGRAIAPLLPAQLRKRHQRLGLDPRQYQGVPLGRAVAGGLPLRGSYEDTVTVIAGPRRNKSVSIVIPAILTTPGTVLATSVKPDIVSATIEYRRTLGTVHVFDPQGLAGAHGRDHVWWNPLRGVHTIEDAAQLAQVFVTASYGEDKQDKFFSENALTVLTDYLFAAAGAGNYLPSVLDWLNRPDDPTPARLLEDTHPELARRIEAQQSLTEKTRSGVFAYARQAMSFIASQSIRAWVAPSTAQPELDPVALVDARCDTLYLLSEEGPGSAGPLIAALTRAVLSAAEEAAKREPSGRRRTPLVAVLDEAGNICRIPDLPSKYTHYGSRGIIPVTILQSQEQGEQVWGRTGFAQLWGASTIQVFGGGNASNTFLRDLSERIGDYEYVERSTSSRGGQRNVSTSRRSERIMDVSDLGSLTLGRMIVFASGCRPALVRSTAWFQDKQLRQRVQTTAAAADAPSEAAAHVA